MGVLGAGSCLHSFFQLKMDVKNLIKKGEKENEITLLLKKFFLEKYFLCCFDPFLPLCLMDFIKIFESHQTLFIVKLLLTLIRELNENADFKKILEKAKELKKEKNKKEMEKIINEYIKRQNNEFINVEEFNQYVDKIIKLEENKSIINGFKIFFPTLILWLFLNNEDNITILNDFARIQNSLSNNEIKELLKYFWEVILTSKDSTFIILNEIYIYFLNYLLKIEETKLLSNNTKKEKSEIEINFD